MANRAPMSAERYDALIASVDAMREVILCEAEDLQRQAADLETVIELLLDRKAGMLAAQNAALAG